MAPTWTAPGRAGRTCCLGSSRADRGPSGRGARAPPEVKSQKPPQMLAVGGTRRDRCSEPRRAGGGGEQWTTCQSECESRTFKEMPFSQKKYSKTIASFFDENGISYAVLAVLMKERC